MRSAREKTKRVGLLATFAATAVALLAFAPPASAAAPQWKITAYANTTAQPGGELTYFVEAKNVGDAATDGSTIEIDLALAQGLGVKEPAAGFPGGATFADVQALGNFYSCTRPDGSSLQAGDRELRCEAPASIGPKNGPLKLILAVAVDPDASLGELLTSEFAVTGGGAPLDAASDQTLVSTAPPPFGIEAFDGLLTDGSGDAFTQAAAHPSEISTRIAFNTSTDPDPLKADFWPVEPIRDVYAELPPGFVGNPTGIAQCTAAELSKTVGPVEEFPLCPARSQVGTAGLVYRAANFGESRRTVPLFNLVPPPGVAARFGFNVLGAVVALDAQLRSNGDYGLTVAVKSIPQGLALPSSEVVFWGTPADPVHDSERACPGNRSPMLGDKTAIDPTCVDGEGNPLYSRPALAPLLRTPTSCGGGAPLSFTSRADSWDHPGALTGDEPNLSDPTWDSKGFVTHEPDSFSPYAPGAPVGQSGCGAVPFEPSISVEPTSHEADSPTGLSFDLEVPQQQCWEEVDSICQADLKDAKVTLPAGMTVNPSSADGLGACSSAQIALDSKAAPTCPDSSKIGTLSVNTPLLDHPVNGEVFLAKQGDNPFGSLIALYLVANDPESGVILKLAGRVDGDQNGTLTTTFTNQPQLPFSGLHLELKSGPRAPLVNPSTCGSYSVQAQLAGWAGNAAANVSDSFQVTSGPGGSSCSSANGFNPSFDAGLTSQLPPSKVSGSNAFVLKLSRKDGEQQFAALNVKMPEGLSGILKGIPYCPDSIANGSGDCPAASRLGIVNAGAGAGPNTFYTPQGSAYLAGPYKDAPLSVVTTVPAKAGPFDLGNVVVRSQLQVNPETAQITVVSDPIPQAVQGIATHLRSIYVSVDRPGFIVPPTSCDPTSIGSTIVGAGGATASPSSPFQMLLCGALGFKPKLSLKLKGSTKRGSNPKLIANLSARPGDANIAATSVQLPKSAFLDQSHIRTVCTRVQFKADQCPKGSIYGKASATSPLVDYALKGNVYLRSSDNELPDLVVALRGPDFQPIEIDLAGRTDSVKGALRNTFDLVPDAPVSSFRLELFGGKRGLVENSRNLCSHTYRAKVLIDGQNGKTADQKPVVKAECGKKARKKGKGGRRGSH